ncbi:MAG: hypothetical protein M1836_007530 [Candelina mexicana]|nr:MAG: hypothetical protein M1836_007530 [Candelina mexicana]
MLKQRWIEQWKFIETSNEAEAGARQALSFDPHSREVPIPIPVVQVRCKSNFHGTSSTEEKHTGDIPIISPTSIDNRETLKADEKKGAKATSVPPKRVDAKVSSRGMASSPNTPHRSLLLLLNSRAKMNLPDDQAIILPALGSTGAYSSVSIWG